MSCRTRVNLAQECTADVTAPTSNIKIVTDMYYKKNNNQQYIIALLLSASTDTPEMKVVGSVLIGLDISFFACTVAALCASIYIIRVKIQKIEQQEKDALEQGDSSSNQSSSNRSSSSVRVVPINSEQKVTDEEEDTMHNTTTNINSSAADQIHANYQSDERHLQQHNERRRGKSMMHTIARVKARVKVRNTKTLHKITMFAKLDDVKIDVVLLKMIFHTYGKNDVICNQGDDAKIFYIIVEGQCSVTIQNDKGERQVKMLTTLDYFGESALLGDDQKRNATVVASSDHVKILQLEKNDFDELVETGVIGYDAIEDATRVAAERSAEVQRGDHLVQGRGGGMVAVDVKSERKEALGGVRGGGSSNTRSLFSP